MLFSNSNDSATSNYRNRAKCQHQQRQDDHTPFGEGGDLLQVGKIDENRDVVGTVICHGQVIIPIAVKIAGKNRLGLVSRIIVDRRQKSTVAA